MVENKKNVEKCKEGKNINTYKAVINFKAGYFEFSFYT